MNKIIFTVCLLCLAVPSVLRGQADTARVKGKPAPAAQTAATSKVTGAALLSEPRDTSDHADNRGDEYFTGTYDNNYQLDNRELYLERDDSENKREDDSQTGQSDQGGGNQE